MRGHVYKRGNTWTAVFDVGDQPRSRCVECGSSSWGLTPRSRCGECGAPVEVRRERRQLSKGGFPTKAAAEAHLADRLAEIVRGALVVPSDITVGEYLSRWLEVHRSQLEPSTDERLLVTLDRGLGDVRAYPPGTHAGVLVWRLDHQSPRAIRREMERIAATVDLEDLSRCIAVWRYGDLRVRRPDR